MAEAQEAIIGEIFSAIQPLRLMDSRSLSKSRNRRYVVAEQHIGKWNNFYRGVMAVTRPHLPDISSVQIPPAPAQDKAKIRQRQVLRDVSNLWSARQ